MHFKDNKEIIVKRAVFVLLTVFTAMLQNTRGLFPRLFGAQAMLLIPLTVCMAMFENDMGGMFLGLCAGVVWDFCAVYTDGFYAMVLLCTGYACAFLIARYMRNNFVTATVYVTVVSVVCVTLYWLIFVLPSGMHGAGMIYLRRYALSVVYTVALTPLYYFFVRAVALKFRKEEIQVAEERLDEKS